MAWFQRNKSSDPPIAGIAPAPNLPALKRQARNRLIGMVVLILAAIGLFTWVLDTDPRPADHDISYEIPARGESVTVHIPAKAQALASNAAASSASANADNQPKANAAANSASANPAAPKAVPKAAPKAAATPEDNTPAAIRARRRAALADNEQFVDDAPLAAGGDIPPAPKAQTSDNAKPSNDAGKAAKEKLAKEKAEREKTAKEKEAKAAKEKAAKEKAAQQKEDQEAARARALLDGTGTAKPEASSSSSSERSVVQFGSFSDADKAAEVRHKVEAAGIKTYTQIIDTPKGKLIRLRVGPFNKDADAQAAARKIKALGLPAAVLSL